MRVRAETGKDGMKKGGEDGEARREKTGIYKRERGERDDGKKEGEMICDWLKVRGEEPIRTLRWKERKSFEREKRNQPNKRNKMKDGRIN